MNRLVFGLLFVTGVALRGYAAINSQALFHPDEHQQYLEQAQRLAFGYGKTFWEQERSLRHELYPGMLAGLLILADRLGLRDPLAQAALLRLLLATSILALLTGYAWRWQRQGRTVAAVVFLALTALAPEMIYLNVRVLSENAMLLPLVAGLLCLDRRPVLAGLWFALMFAIRFQSAFFILACLALLVFEDICLEAPEAWSVRTAWRARSVQLVGGLLVGLLVVGGVDRWRFGSWFHSPIAYFQATIVEGMAALSGIEPWYRYLDWVGTGLLGTSMLAPVLLLLGALREWRLTWMIGLYVFAHSLVGHKEFRFVWTIWPLMLALVAVGVEWLWQVQPRWLRVPSGAVIALSFALGFGVRTMTLEWNTDPYRTTAVALTKVGRQADVTGVAVCGVPSYLCGNYFYLRRNIPLLTQFTVDLSTLVANPALADGTVNYLVARPEDLGWFAPWNPELIETVSAFGIYALHRERTIVPASMSALLIP